MTRRIAPFLAAVAAVMLSLGTTPTGVDAATASHSTAVPRRSVMRDVSPVLSGETRSAPATRRPAMLAPAAAAPGGGSLSRETFGVALGSSFADPTVGYPSWNFSLLSTVDFFALNVNTDGTLAQDSEWTAWNSAALNQMVATAHAHGTRVVVTADLQDWSSTQANLCSGLQHSSVTVGQIAAQVAAKGVDGVNLDYEGYGHTCANGQTTGTLLTQFARSLRAAMPSAYLSVDSYASSAADSSGLMNIPALSPSVDAFFVMAYDMDGSNWSSRPPGCTSYCLSPTAPLTNYAWNDSGIAQQYLAVVPASKVILGVPYYGYKSCVSTGAPNQSPTAQVVADTYLDASTEYTAPNIRSYSAHRDGNDPSGGERWDTWFNTTLNCTRELYWDDTTSLAAKYDLVNRLQLRGAGFWALNYGGSAPELWSLLQQKFASRLNLGGVAISGPDAASWGGGRRDLFVVGNDHAVWHNYSNDGSTWAGWESLGGYATSDPSAVSWGPGRMDVFVRGADNAVWQRSWDGTGWSGWSSAGGFSAAGPDAASTGSGQIELFCRGADNALWERVFSNGTWLGGWFSLGGVLTSDPSAASPALGTVAVFARGTDRALWSRTWNGTGWSPWASLGGTLAGGPDAGSAHDGHIDVAVIGQDRALWRISYQASGGWQGWNSLGGYWTSDPTTVDAGNGVADFFARGADGASTWEVLSSY